MRLVTMVLLVLAAATAQAQGVRQDAVTPDDILKLYDHALALEVDIPEGATTFALAYGSVVDRHLMSTFIPDHGGASTPTQLRIVVLPADPSVVDSCAAGEAEAIVIAIPHSDQGISSHHRLKVCVPHPERSAITGESRSVIEGPAPGLSEWTPLVFQTWLARTGQDAEGVIDSAVDLGHNLLVEVHFGGSNSTAADLPSALSLDQLSALPGVAELIEEYGVLESP